MTIILTKNPSAMKDLHKICETVYSRNGIIQNEDNKQPLKNEHKIIP